MKFFAFSFWPKRPPVFIGSLSALLLILVFAFYSVLPDANLRWVYFSSWLVGIGGLGLSLYLLEDRKQRSMSFSTPVLWGVVFLVVIALFARLYHLGFYPFMLAADATRDAGLEAMRMVTGQEKNIFQFAVYEAHGRIIAIFAALFYLVFGNIDAVTHFSTISVALATILLVYYLLYRLHSPVAAFGGALCLATVPYAVFLHRAYLVDTFDGFFMAVILLAVWNFLARKTTPSFLLLALALGLASGFHGAIRAAVFLTVPVALLLFQLFAQRQKRSLRHRFLGTAAFCALLVAGLGLATFHIDPLTFFDIEEVEFLHRALLSSEPLGGFEISSALNQAGQISRKYWQSLGVYFVEPTRKMFLPFRAPLLPLSLALFFLLGIVFAIRNFRPLHAAFFYYLFLLPFTNSAATRALNQDNRLVPLFVLAAVFVGLGLHAAYIWCQKQGRMQWAQAVVGLFTLLCLFQLWSFFFFELGKNKDPRHFLPEFASRAVRHLENQCTVERVCVHAHKEDMVAVRGSDRFKYLTPSTKLQYTRGTVALKRNEILLTPRCGSLPKKTFRMTFCATAPYPPYCPQGKPSPIGLRIDARFGECAADIPSLLEEELGG